MLAKMYSTSQSKQKIEQISYLPEVFMIKHLNGQLEKISLVKYSYITCEKYVSKSKGRFWGCYKYHNGNFKEINDGIYYIQNHVRLMYFQRYKLTRYVKEMPEIIEKILSAVRDLKNKTRKPFLISYDNYGFEVYDKFTRGKLYQFDLLFNKGNLEIYDVPPPKNPNWLDWHDLENIDIKITNNLTIYNHEIQFSSQIKAFNLRPTPGTAYLINPQNPLTLTLRSPEYGENSIVLTANKYYLITHPKPSK